MLFNIQFVIPQMVALKARKMFLDVCFRLSMQALHTENVPSPGAKVNRGVIQIVIMIGNIVCHAQVKAET